MTVTAVKSAGNDVSANLEPTPAAPKPAAEALPEVTGYDSEIRFYATRYRQGGRTVYSVDLSPMEIAALIPAPDPNKLSPGNRMVRPEHAKGFARYLRERENWVSPSMILRAAPIFQFETQAAIAGVEFGVLSFPRLAMMDLHILDGQHRTLGIHMAVQNIAADLEKARNQKSNARRVDPDGAAAAEAEKRIRELEGQRARLSGERLGVQIFVEDELKAARQMSFDINDNALGLTGSVKARFDATKVVNRALESVLEHELLDGRVDVERDRIGRGSPYLMGAKHVAEVIRSVRVGLQGRVSRRQDQEWNENELARKTKDFLNVLVAAFPQFQALLHGQISPEQLRKTSLLGSVLMVRVLAGTYRDLKQDHAFSDDMVEQFFQTLAPHMAGPVYPGSIWAEHTDQFSDGAMAPHGRRQDLDALNKTIIGWAIDKPTFLAEPPTPKPEPAAENAEVTEAEADKILRPETAKAREAVAKKTGKKKA